MPQKIAAIIIIAAAVIYVVRRIYKIAKNPEKELTCDSDKCAGCPMKTEDCKPDDMK